MVHLAKSLVGVVALGMLIPGAALADPNPVASAVPAAGTHYTTQDTTIGDLLADPAAKAIVDKYIPGLSDNPQISMAAGATLRGIQPMAADKITPEKLDAIDAELAKLPPK